MGAIHTIQGYDLNYAGVIGPDLRFNRTSRRLYFARDSYFDKKGKQKNKMLGASYTDDDLLAYITNIYRVLLTRGIRGTYVYVCDPELRAYLADFIPPAEGSSVSPRSVAPIADIVHPQDARPAYGDSFLIEPGEPLPQDEATIDFEQSGQDQA